MLLDGVDDLVDSSPLILVLGATANDTEALEDVDDVVDTPPFDSELSSALIEIEQAFLGCSIQKEESTAELSQAFLFAIVSCMLATLSGCLTIGDLRRLFGWHGWLS